MSTRLSVNINKVALIRNSRPGNFPDLMKFAQDCEMYGAEGITVHPRPDERHVRYEDLSRLKSVVKTELNVEGNPTKRFVDEVFQCKPHQVTLVPDDPNALTSDQGWDTVRHKDFLKEITAELQAAGIRVSVFVDASENMVEGAKEVGADCIELYTGKYAKDFYQDKERAVAPHARCAKLAHSLGLLVNAGHDLNLDNLQWYKDHVDPLHEVSIGHALTVDSIYFGVQNAIRMYGDCLG